MRKSLLLPLSLITVIMLSFSGCSSNNSPTEKEKEAMKEIDKKVEIKQTETNDEKKKEKKVNEGETLKPKEGGVAATKESGSSSNKGNVKNITNSNKSSTTKNDNPGFYGTWTINRVMATGKGTSYSNEDIQKLIGRTVSFSQSSASVFTDDIKSFGKKIQNPEYDMMSVSKKTFEEQDPVGAQKLNLQASTLNEVRVLDAKQSSNCTFYIKDNKTLILYGGGVYFELIKN